MATLRIVTFDESGNFEIPDKFIRLVGGLVIQAEGVKDTKAYMDNINKEMDEFLKEQVNGYNDMLRDKDVKFIKDGKDYPVSVSYPESLHTKRGETYFYMDRSFDFHGIQDFSDLVIPNNAKIPTFGSFINRKCLSYIKSKKMDIVAYIYPFRDNDNVVEEINSNITSTEVGANLYVRMAALLMSNCIFYHFDDSPQEYQLKLARRSLPVNIKSVEELSNQAAADNRYYHITDQGIYKNLLSSEIYEQDPDSTFVNANYHFGVEKIDYMQAGKDMPIYYMSDTICSYLQFIINSEVDKKKNIGRKEALEIYEKIRSQAGRELNIQIRYYDKADLLFRKMYSNAVTADLAKMYEQEYIMHKNGLKGELLKVSPDPESQRDRRDYEISGYYDEVLVPQLENYVSELLKTEKYRKLVEARFAEYLDYTESFMGRGDDLSYDKGLYIIEKLNKLSEVLTEDQIKRKTGATLFKLNDIRLRALNHKGTVSGLIPVVEECEKYRQFVNPFDYIDFKIRTSQLYFNSFEYDKAKEMFLQVAENRNGDLNSALDNLESAVAVLTGGAGTSGIGISGKVFSSLGQAYAFAGDKETSERRFKEALEKWGDDKGNRNITMSYLLHMYIDNGEKESYESFAPEYFGYFNTDETLDLTTREGQLEALSKCYENHGFIRYALFIFVKAFYAFYRKSEQGIPAKIAALIERMEKNKDTGNNPWQNIYKYMYRMALENGSQKNADKYAAKVFEEVSGDAAVSVIRLNFELEKYLDADGDENKTLSEFLQNSCIKDIEKKLGEFPCFEGIADKSVADAKALLDSRLTYMYR